MDIATLYTDSWGKVNESVYQNVNNDDKLTI